MMKLSPVIVIVDSPCVPLFLDTLPFVTSNVKWLSKIEISKSEAEGAWQEGLNCKILPPSVTDAKNVDLKKMPSMTEVAVFSGIRNMEMAGRPKLKP